MGNSEPVQVYQIKVTLNSIRPPIWRRILVPDKITLLDLHDVIQDVFGWLNYHLHEFTIRDESYGDPANDEFGELEIQDETKIKLRKLGFTKGSRFTYEYDFGDSWEHILVVEKVLPFEKGMKLPQCIKGKRACPPEDVGGPWGYEGFLEAINDPRNEEHDSYLEWVGGEFDSEAFDLDIINQRLLQRGKRNWPGNDSSVTEEAAGNQISAFHPTRWANLLAKDGSEMARSIALRQDVVTFLNYLKEYKVVGTQSTGNLPRRAIEGITPRFVKPHLLETKIGDAVFRYRTEDDIWSIYFVHVLAQGANLISGGPSRRWRLTPVGECFMTLPAVAQIWVLFTTWWYRINWQIAYSYDIFGDEVPEKFSQTVATLMRNLPVEEPQLFERFADQLIEAMGWKWPKKEPDTTRIVLRAGIEHMVINPLEKFGVISTQREKDNTRLIDIQFLVSFALTQFGRVLLESI
ncbi:MAG: plasmid pRiA4b ORF-3 family protein [Anaerolineaceae bacterium]|nr:plasmid pRiA4b ORF-3 family protein [Anaerolineaceae bacterium]